MRIVTVIVVFLSFLTCAVSEQKKLKQVVILSRHNLRTPLSRDLESVTPKKWPVWTVKRGYLTQKGAILEGFMGNYFAKWLYKEKLLPYGCPSEEDVYIYANIEQRTVASATAFVSKAFPGCNVTVHHNDTNKMDPIFKPVIHNGTDIFKQQAIEQMEELLKSLQLKNSYEDINEILDYRDSKFCKVNKQCDLTKDSNKIVDVKVNFKPNIKGPLKICNSVLDAFKMEFYEGFDVAWGLLNNSKEWKNVMNASRGFHNVIFNTKLIADDISKPLLNYMTEIFLNNTLKPKMLLLMGHDANIYTILKSMRFKKYSLHNQHEETPIGGKIVFQRWSDGESKKDFLKIDYVYGSNEQLRNAEELSLASPPQFTVLQLEGCDIDDQGFCPWDDFVQLLRNLTYNL